MVIINKIMEIDKLIETKLKMCYADLISIEQAKIDILREVVNEIEKATKQVKENELLHSVIERFPLAMDTLQLPATYDSEGQSIIDKNNNKILDVRGWGNIKYLYNPEKRQDDIGKLLTELLNAL